MEDVLLYLIIYSFFGWCCECVYCSFRRFKWINRGFLNGPFCPIYGFGAVAVLGFLQLLPRHILIVFIGGMFITSLLEYITSWLMEKMFNARWWDYSEYPFNINGRVCLLNSTLFGLLCLVLYYRLHPWIYTVTEQFSYDFKLGFLFALGIYLAADFALAIKGAMGINIRIKALEELREQILVKYADIDGKLDFQQIEERLRTLNKGEVLLEKIQSMRKEVGFFERRMIKSFPEMVNRSHPERLEEIKESIRLRRRRL